MANVFPGRIIDSVNGEVGKIVVIEDRHIVWEQTVPANNWILPIPWDDKIPTITVFDSSGARVEVEEDYSVQGQITIKSNEAFTGKVVGN